MPDEPRWKSDDEWAPYHPSASHAPPDYRYGWNAAYYIAPAELEQVKAERDALIHDVSRYMTIANEELAVSIAARERVARLEGALGNLLRNRAAGQAWHVGEIDCPNFDEFEADWEAAADLSPLNAKGADVKAEREICEAVSAAIGAGMTPEEFMQACWAAWEDELFDKLRRDNSAFKAMKGPT